MLEEWGGDAILKSVMDPQDAIRAKEMGFHAISISNHGGRQLDGEVALLDMLTSIRVATGPQFPLILDGGIRRGTDILKAIGLGANAVSFARPYLYSLAAEGVVGVRRSLEILASELKLSMALLGITNVSEITSEMVRPFKGGYRVS